MLRIVTIVAGQDISAARSALWRHCRSWSLANTISFGACAQVADRGVRALPQVLDNSCLHGPTANVVHGHERAATRLQSCGTQCDAYIR